MTTRERFQRVESLFRAALDLPEAHRGAFLVAQCGEDEALSDEVLAMLRADSRTGGPLDNPALAAGLRVIDLPFAGGMAKPTDPERIGHYRILRRIGEGGMGIVYEAEQESPLRTVALKVMSRGLGSRAALDRFRHEAQVLARLQHPGIAQIFEAGIDDWGEGPQPFFAMEFVRGRTLLEHAAYCDATIPARLALLARVCDAVHHAHQKGVVHRDLKPSNVVVEEIDAVVPESSDSVTDVPGSARPKVLDFGIARVLDPDMTSPTIQTSVGQVVGTLQYMSPEQAVGNAGAIDIRSDVYSLGVIAYELLASRLPYEVRSHPLAEALRIVQEQEAPRLGSIDRSLRGDVETIVAKAIEKEPRRRYASAAELASDLRRTLRHEPIHARRASGFYHLSRFARRNRGLVGAALIAVLGLIAATAASMQLAVVANRAGAEERRLRGIADDRTAEARREGYRLSLAAAVSSLRFHEVEEARRQLESSDPDLRGWEWDHLYSRLDDSLAVLDTGARRVSRVCFSPDGGALIASTTNGDVHAWPCEVGSEVAFGPRRDVRIPGGYQARWSLDMLFNEEGTEVLVGTRSGVAMLDAVTLAFVRRAPTGGPVVALGAHGRLVAVDRRHKGGAEGIAIERLGDGTTALELGDLRRDSSTACFSPDGTQAAHCENGSSGLVVVSIEDGRRILERSDLRFASDLCFSPDGTTLAVATMSERACLLSLDGGNREIPLGGHLATIGAIAFAPDGTVVATASSDHTVRLWSAVDGAALSTMHGNVDAPTDIAFSPDGSIIATACRDGSIRVWSAHPRTDPFVLPAPHTVYDVAFSPDGRQLVAACLGGDRPLRIWDAATLEPIAAFGEGTLSAVAVSQDGTQLVVGRAHGDTLLFKTDGTLLSTLPGHWWRTDWVAFAPDGAGVLSAGNAGRLIDHAIGSGAVRARRRIDSSTTELGCRAAIDPTGDCLAASAGSNVLLLDARSLEERGSLAGHSGRVLAIAFSADGRRLATGSADDTVRVWDLAGGRELAVLRGHSEDVYAVAFTPDGRRLASGGNDRSIRIWDLQNFDELMHLAGHGGFVYCLAFSPDGHALASGSADDTVRVWDTRPLRALPLQ